MRKRISGLKAEEIKNINQGTWWAMECWELLVFSLSTNWKFSIWEIEEISDEPVTNQDFEDALAKVQSSIAKHDLELYSKWMAEYGSA
jgi:SpoVK/Ycf46/Vps4 family AAA+-type ATPase